LPLHDPIRPSPLRNHDARRDEPVDRHRTDRRPVHGTRPGIPGDRIHHPRPDRQRGAPPEDHPDAVDPGDRVGHYRGHHDPPRRLLVGWTLSALSVHRVRWMAILAVPFLLLTGFSGPTAAVISPTGRLPTAPTTFHTYASLVSELQNLSRAHPSLLTVTTIGSSWETKQGLANRSLFAAEVRVPGGTKKDVLFMGLHHAEEWISLEFVVYLLRYVLLNAGNDSRFDTILARANLGFVPLVNPHGLEYDRLND